MKKIFIIAMIALSVVTACNKENKGNANLPEIPVVPEEVVIKALAIPSKETDVPYKRDKVIKNIDGVNSEFEENYRAEWNRLQGEIEKLSGTFMRDDIDWAVELDGKYAVKNYNFSDDGEEEIFFLYNVSKEQLIRRDKGLLAKSYLDANEASVKGFQELYNSGNKAISSYERTFDNNGFILTESYYEEDASSVLYKESKFTYNDRLQLVKVEYTEDNSKNATYEYSYDQSGRLATSSKTGETTDDWFGEWEWYKHPYIMNNKVFDYTTDEVVYQFHEDNSIKSIKYPLSGTAVTRSFDNKGQVIEIIEESSSYKSIEKLTYNEHYLVSNNYSRLDSYNGSGELNGSIGYKDIFDGDKFLGVEVNLYGTSFVLEAKY